MNENTNTAVAQREQQTPVMATMQSPTVPMMEMAANPAVVFHPEVFQSIMPVAQIMSQSGNAVPAWLRNNAGGCFSICIYAAQWQMNPFGLASDSFCIEGGTVSFGAKSTHAIVEKVCGDSFQHEFHGDWDKILGNVVEKTSAKGTKYFAPGWEKFGAVEDGLAVTVWLRSDPERKLTLKMKQCIVRNSTNWASNPQLQLFYQACKVWARMYKPGAMMGVYSVDEMQDYVGEEKAAEAPQSAGKPAQRKTNALKAKLGVKAPETEKLSDKIKADIANRNVPVTLEDISAYFAAKGVTKNIDDPTAWKKELYERFTVNISGSVDAIAVQIMNESTNNETEVDGNLI
jgi:hypothetical protein